MQSKIQGETNATVENFIEIIGIKKKSRCVHFYGSWVCQNNLLKKSNDNSHFERVQQ